MFTTPVTQTPHQKKQPRHNTEPKFGWDFATHQAIERSAIETLPSSAFRDFAQDNFSLIHANSVNQDKNFKGPFHYLELDVFPNHSYSKERRTFINVFTHFVKKQKDTKFINQWKDFDTKVLTEHKNNAFAAITENYWKLCELLNQCHDESLLNNPKTNIPENIANTIGTLAHYVGDIHQPLHTTGYYDWPMQHEFKTAWDFINTRIHFFTDSAFAQGTNLRQWRQDTFKQFQTKPTLKKALKNEEVRQLVLDGAINTHAKVRDVVQMDADARQSSTTSKDYIQTLLDSWTPIATKQMRDASTLLNTLLQSAYIRAGSPVNFPNSQYRDTYDLNP